MVLLIPINGMVATKQRSLQMKQMRNKDERIKLMNETLNGMKVRVCECVCVMLSFETCVAKGVETVRVGRQLSRKNLRDSRARTGYSKESRLSERRAIVFFHVCAVCGDLSNVYRLCFELYGQSSDIS